MARPRRPATVRAWPVALVGLALAAVLPAAPQSAAAGGLSALAAWRVPTWSVDPPRRALDRGVDVEAEEAGSPAKPPEPVDDGRCSESHAVVHHANPHRIRHVVAPRETLDRIAYRYRVSPAQLRAWNDLPADLETVRRGTRLEVKTTVVPPPRRKIEYTVREGDTWWRVGVAHGVDAADLRAYNWPYQGKMRPGERLSVWVDPIVYDWIRSGPPLSFEEEGSVIRRGGISVGPPDAGRLINGVQIPEGDGYRLRFPESAYGSTHAVTQLVSGMRAFRDATSWTGEIAIGAMSRSRGGPLGSHASHQSGRDVDIRLPRRAGVSSWASLTPSRVDWTATWDLVVALASVDTQVIFLEYKAQRRLYRAAVASGASAEALDALLQYPRGSHARRGLVRHADGHDKHLHVRFGCGPCETECVEQSMGEQP